VTWMAKAGLLSSRLLRLCGLGVRRRDGAVAVLTQLRGAGESIRSPCSLCPPPAHCKFAACAGAAGGVATAHSGKCRANMAL
jgi:hypothetical protein